MQEKHYKLTTKDLDKLLQTLRGEGFVIISPKEEGGVMTTGELGPEETPPAGMIDRQAPGSYRLEKKGDLSLFSFTLPMQSWRRHVHPPHETLFSTEITGDGFEIEEADFESSPMVFFGIRACDLRGLEVLDRVFLESRFEDLYYRRRRKNILVIAADCFSPAETCFCTSVGLGPVHETGYDIALCEIEPGIFLARALERGQRYLKGFGEAAPEEIVRAGKLAEESRNKMTRRFDLNHAKEVMQLLDHPAWDAVANRCLACANCTLVCPTCFCSSIDESPSIDGESSARIRRWDSCFHVSHSYIHGGHIRTSVKSRYRQWLTHKLFNTDMQFGTSGCTGCGRCITWCPAAIDFTQDIVNFPAKEGGRVST